MILSASAMAMQKLMKVGWFGTKGAIVGGAVYVSIDQGIWTDTNHRKLQETMKNIREIMPVDINVTESLPLPKADDENVNYRSYWNSGVFWTFGTIADFPSKVISLKDYLFDFASSPPPLPSTEVIEQKVQEVTSEAAHVEVISESAEPLEVAAVVQENENN